ncbi:MAG TPA: hemerythrin domain-containing protein, partial [Acidimicrobiales bacterium]|nr:hemerythrin domain-containing protein [Acidimicrobiales bacterium]
MDAITMLKDDHRTVEKLFKRFEKAGDRAHAEKREVVDRIIEELSVHAAVEEQLFYPVTRATVPAVEDVALESLEEHHIVKWVLSELDRMDPKDERFDAKVTVLIENVRHHVEEEEDDYFPKVRDELGRAALSDLGEAMEAAKAVAPTHPHPRSPDSPPGNVVVGPAAGMVDRMGDTVSGLAQGGASVVGDVIARVLGRKKPRTAPKGSTTARRTASKVRASGADATEAVIEAVRDAKQSAKAGAKRATSQARRGTKRATSTAKRRTTTAASKAKRTTTTAKRSTTKRATATRRTVAKRA